MFKSSSKVHQYLTNYLINITKILIIYQDLLKFMFYISLSFAAKLWTNDINFLSNW